MENLICSFFGLWLIIGDLNSIFKKPEKRGGSSSGLSSSSSFLNFVSNTGAIDLGFNGPRFTWSNRREGWANVRERLDRGLCNDDWQRLFPRVGIRHLSTPNSDHNPIILDTHLELQKGVRPFRFEAMWEGMSLVRRWLIRLGPCRLRDRIISIWLRNFARCKKT